MQPNSIAFPRGATDVCRIVMICEDVNAYDVALRVCERLLVRLGDEVPFAFDCWTFAELIEGRSAAKIARTTKDADIIMLSTCGGGLPLAVSLWLEMLPSVRKSPGGALAWIPNESLVSESVLEPVSAKLEQVARQLGMDFLPPKVRPEPVEHPAGDFESEMWTLPVVSTGRHGKPPCDHWGLNE